MESLRLTHLNSSFQIDDKHGHKKLRITKLDFITHPGQRIPSGLRLEIQDENGVLLFSEPIDSFLAKESVGKVACIRQEFAVFGHLTVRLTASGPNPEFEADLYYLLSR